MKSLEEVRSVESHEISIEFKAGEIRSVREKKIVRTGMRLFREGKVALASVVGESTGEALRDQAENMFVHAAIPASYVLPEPQVFEETLAPSLPLKADQLVHELSNCLSHLKKEAPEFLFMGQAEVARSTHRLTRNDGLKFSLGQESSSWSVGFKDRNSASIMDGYFGSGSLTGIAFSKQLTRELALLRAHRTKLPARYGRLPVMWADPAELCSKLTESLRADQYHRGSALYAGRLGQPLFHTDLSLYDVRWAPTLGVARAFDSEGFRLSEPALPLIEKGVFSNIIYDLQMGHKYGHESTGNGLAPVGSQPQLGFHSLSLGTGSKSLEQWSKDLGEFIYIGLAGGGDFTDDGSYSTPVQLAYMIKDGHPVGRLPEFVLKSSVAEMFGTRFLGTSSDTWTPGALNPSMFVEMELLPL